MPKIAVDEDLNYLKNYLQKRGFEVIGLNSDNEHPDVYIISGEDKNFMGMEDISTKAPVINAKGLTPNQVYEQLSTHI